MVSLARSELLRKRPIISLLEDRAVRIGSAQTVSFLVGLQWDRGRLAMVTTVAGGRIREEDIGIILQAKVRTS